MTLERTSLTPTLAKERVPRRSPLAWGREAGSDLELARQVAQSLANVFVVVRVAHSPQWGKLELDLQTYHLFEETDAIFQSPDAVWGVCPEGTVGQKGALRRGRNAPLHHPR